MKVRLACQGAGVLLALAVAGCGGRTSLFLASGAGDDSTDAGGDGPPLTLDAASKLDAGPTDDASACNPDAGPGTAYALLDGAPNDPTCPAAWSDLVDGAGDPAECSTDGLVCVYPQGQAQCAPDGQTLQWWQVGSSAGCSEFPPVLCGSCGVPGTQCDYMTGAPPNGPSSKSYVTSVCCSGATGRWEIESNTGCPNGNACGTIEASDYDQKCVADSDCTGVTQGDLCTLGCTDCVNAAINVSALAQYEADFTSRLSTPRDCPCPPPPPLRCRSGACTLAP